MTPERYKKLTDWLEGHPALREGIILLNRWLPSCLSSAIRCFWCCSISGGSRCSPSDGVGGALDFMQVIARVHSRSGSGILAGDHPAGEAQLSPPL